MTNGAVTEHTLTHDAADNIIGDNQGTEANFSHTINRDYDDAISIASS